MVRAASAALLLPPPRPPLSRHTISSAARGCHFSCRRHSLALVHSGRARACACAAGEPARAGRKAGGEAGGGGRGEAQGHDAPGPVYDPDRPGRLQRDFRMRARRSAGVVGATKSPVTPGETNFPRLKMKSRVTIPESGDSKPTKKTAVMGSNKNGGRSILKGGQKMIAKVPTAPNSPNKRGLQKISQVRRQRLTHNIAGEK